MPAPQHVVDVQSNRNENIVNRANAIGRSKRKRKLVAAVYYGKRKIKTVRELMTATGLSQVEVLDLGRELDVDGLFHIVQKDGLTAYQKDAFVERHKNKILALAGNPAKIAKVATKSSPKAMAVMVKVASPPNGKVKLITIDDIDSFSKVKKIGRGKPSIAMPEAQFKAGMQKVIGEPYAQPDWGGEKGDLSTTRLRLKGKRTAAAFAFKGPGVKGPLTPAKMGKRGDQIANLFEADAQIYFVQYWDAPDPVLQKHMHVFAQFHAGARGTIIWYGVIDGDDSARLIAAYPKAFGKKPPVKKKP